MTKPGEQHHNRHSLSSSCSSSTSAGNVPQRHRRTSSSHSKPEEVTQAGLLRGRGNLTGAKLCFNVMLESRPTSTKNPLRGLGMQLTKQEAVSATLRSPELRVDQIADSCRGVPTALHHWNNQCRKSRQAAHALRPGDTLSAVNGSRGGDYGGMLQELASISGVQASQLSIERELGDLLVPVGAPVIRIIDHSDKTVATSSCADSGDETDILAVSFARLKPDSCTHSDRPMSAAFSELSTRAPTPTSRDRIHSCCTPPP